MAWESDPDPERGTIFDGPPALARTITAPDLLRLAFKIALKVDHFSLLSSAPSIPLIQQWLQGGG